MEMARSEVGRVKLGSQGFEVSAQDLGCMSMSIGYGLPKPEEEMVELIRHVVDTGVTFLDTSDLYGPFTNEILIGKAIKGIHAKVQLATKFALVMEAPGQIEVRGNPEHVHLAGEASLKRLDVDYIDLYYQHRVDPTVPIEVTVGEMMKLVEEGKVKYLGLSLKPQLQTYDAHTQCIQSQLCNWNTRCGLAMWKKISFQHAGHFKKGVGENSFCRELGIGIVAYSPLGMGFVAGYKPEEAVGSDFRQCQPRLQGENLVKNQQIRDRVQEIADLKKCSLNQLALAWVLHKGKDIVPIPGIQTSKNDATIVLITSQS